MRNSEILFLLVASLACSGSPNPGPSCGSMTWAKVAGSPAGTAISGSGPNDVWILAGNGVMRGGTTWTAVPTDCTDSGGSLDALWVSGANDVWIAGTSCGGGDSSPNLRHWDGTSWTPFETHDNREVYAFWGTSPNDVWGATTQSNAYLGHWDGQTWSHVDSAHYGPLAGGAPGDFWVAGTHIVHDTSSGDVASIDLTTLGVDETACMSAGTACVNAAWASGPSDVWFVADGGKALHFDGTSWTATSTGTSNDLKSVWGSSSSDVWAVGGGGTILHFDGTRWSSVASPTTSDLTGVWSSGPCDVWAIGDAVYHGSP